MPQANIINVNLSKHSYSIHIGENLLNDLTILLKSLNLGKQIAIISNPTITQHYLDKIQQQLNNKYQCISILLKDGETHKNQQSLQHIYDQLIKHQFNRNCTLIALGGGVIGDITGFAAATWMRGVKFIQIPTSLLAQVDSAVGGKTGINHPQAKNMIGAFHQPIAVITDTSTLNTLAPRQLNSGLAEIIKYGLIWDKDFFAWLEQNIDKLISLDTPSLTYAIQRSCQIKAEIVSQDEHENNIRALLNFGHTFGHAIETLTAYNDWLHGEAISMGMVMASQLSQREGLIQKADCQRIQAIFSKAKLPTQLSTDFSVRQYLTTMQQDKKNTDTGLALILLAYIGKAITSTEYCPNNLKHVLANPAND